MGGILDTVLLLSTLRGPVLNEQRLNQSEIPSCIANNIL